MVNILKADTLNVYDEQNLVRVVREYICSREDIVATEFESAQAQTAPEVWKLLTEQERVSRQEAFEAAKQAREEAKEAETAVAKLERQLPKLRADVAAAEERAADLSSRLADLEAAAATSKEDAAALKALEKEVAEATAALEAVQRDAAGLRAEVETLQKAMDDVGGDALRAQRATVKSLAEGIAAASEAMLEKRATAASHAKATARVTKSIEEATVERAQLSEDVKATKEAFATLEDEAGIRFGFDTPTLLRYVEPDPHRIAAGVLAFGELLKNCHPDRFESLDSPEPVD